MPKHHAAMIIALAGVAMFGSEARSDPSLECPGDNQVEVRDCLSETEARVDAALAIVVGFARESAESQDELMGGSAAMEAFEAGQTAWEAYRDDHCDYVGSTFGGGSGTAPAIYACRITHARARMEELMSLI